MGGPPEPELMTVPKNQPTASKKARTVQRTDGGKYTAVLAAQTCGRSLDPWAVSDRTCARAPHPDGEPCSADRNFDIAGWKEQVATQWAANEARRAALTDEERAEEDRLGFEDEYDDGRTASDEWEDARSYKWED